MKRLALALVMSLLLAGCESGTKSDGGAQKAEKKEKPPECLTARVIFQKFLASAKMWAPDARPYRVTSETVSDCPGKDGTASVWRGWFASPGRRSIKLFTWVGTGPDRGITSGTEDTYNASNSSTQIFDSMYLKVDSDKAFSVAQQHGGEKLLKATPNLPVLYVLDWNPRENQLVWHVLYGGTGMDTKLRIAVDASSGNYLRLEK